MIGTPAIRNLIREDKVAQMYSAIQTGQQLGMQTLDQNLQDLVQRNIDLAAEARASAQSTRTTFRAADRARPRDATETHMERDQAIEIHPRPAAS